jgi:hypothetical protein
MMNKNGVYTSNDFTSLRNRYWYLTVAANLLN